MDDYKNYCVKNDSIYDSPTRTFSENCLYSRSFDMQLRHRELVLSSRTESISGFPTGQIFLHHRIGWWENLQESPIFEDFDGKNHGLPVNFPFNQSSDYSPPSIPRSTCRIRFPGLHDMDRVLLHQDKRLADRLSWLDTVDGCEILHQLIYVVECMIYRFNLV